MPKAHAALPENVLAADYRTIDEAVEAGSASALVALGTGRVALVRFDLTVAENIEDGVNAGIVPPEQVEAIAEHGPGWVRQWHRFRHDIA